jgi:hypothetical protein
LIAIEHAVVVRCLQLRPERGMAMPISAAHPVLRWQTTYCSLKRPMRRATLPAASVAAFIGHIANPTAMSGSEAERSYKCPRDRARERLFLADMRRPRITRRPLSRRPSRKVADR